MERVLLTLLGVSLMVYTDFAEAQAAAEAAGQVVLGTCRKDQAPTYILIDDGADDLTIRNTAFEHLNGRPIAPQEETLIAMAEARNAG